MRGELSHSQAVALVLQGTEQIERTLKRVEERDVRFSVILHDTNVLNAQIGKIKSSELTE